MEDVLEVYQRPRDPNRPLVCLDEATKQLIKETRVPVPAKPGQPARHDYEYERNGTANLFMLFAPLQGWRHVEVTDRRTAVDYAQVLKALSDRHFPAASKSIGASQTCEHWQMKSPPGTHIATTTTPRQIGVHHRQCTRQAETPIPGTMSDSRH